MAEHYPRNTVEASAWCAHCAKFTMHRIDGVRKGPCLDCMARQEAESQARRAESKPAQQENLFGGAK